MSNPQVFYREEPPSAETSHFVLSYWRFTISAETPEPIMHEVSPLASGTGGDFTFAAKGENFEWGLNFPGTKILYIISFKDGVWNEIGKMSRDDGKTWFQFFEMNLKKV